VTARRMRNEIDGSWNEGHVEMIVLRWKPESREMHTANFS
jgi:hypothetical protein